MNQTPLNMKLAVTPRSVFSEHSNVVQVLQSRTPGYSPIPVQSMLTSPSVQMNTNTAVQYARKPQEMTIVGPNGTFMSGPLPQPYGHVVSLNQNNNLNIPTGTNFVGPGISMSTPNVNNLTNSRKPCNCTKSHCLKLYCECFAQGQLCQNCNCNNCMNNLAYEEERGRAIKMTLERNPSAFHPKIGRGEGERKHTKGCNCKRSGCLKNYCECYEAKISCSDLCRCQGCRNTEDSIERRSLMRLAAMGSLRSRQPSVFKKYLSKPPQETLPHVFFTWETIEATASCMLAQAEDAERRDLPPVSQERIILEEFGRAVDRVIEAASKAQIRSVNSSLMAGVGNPGLSDDMTISSNRGPLGSNSAVASRLLRQEDEDEMDNELMHGLHSDDQNELLDDNDDEEDDDDDLLDANRRRSYHRRNSGSGNIRRHILGSHHHLPTMLNNPIDDDEDHDTNDRVKQSQMHSVKFVPRERSVNVPHSSSYARKRMPIATQSRDIM